LAKEMEVIEKARKRQQEIKEKEWAAVQKKNEEKQRIRQARDKRIGDAIENFLKKRWKLLIAIILVVIAYDLITPDDPKTKKTPVKNNSQSKIDINAVDINTNKIVENIELNDVAISSDTKKVLEEIIVNTSRPKELIEEKIIIDKDKTEKHSSKLSAEEQYNIGIKYFDKDTEEDYTKSFGYFEESAEKGYIESQYYLAHLYYTGNGVPKNNLKAGNWYEKAATQGHIESQYILGTMFETLHIATQDNDDYESAAYWYKKAADQGHSTAQYYLGNMYATGRGVSKNDKMAAYWHQKAANQGHSTAQYSLGIMYMNGRGVNKNVIKSLNLIKKSASQGYVKAQNFLALKRYQSLSFCFKYYKDCMTADDEEYIKLWLNQAINSSNTKESKIAEDRLKKWF
jgi:TPR repeat protein